MYTNNHFFILFKQITVAFFVLIYCICFGQNKSIYEKAIKEYNTESYKLSYLNFQLAKQQFLNQKDIPKTINCLAYLAKIESLQSDYKSSISSCNEALSYINKYEFDNDSIYSELMSSKALNLKSLGEFNSAFSVSDSLVDYLTIKNEGAKYLANAYQIKSRVEIDLGNYNDAINTAKKALRYNNIDQERKAALLNIIGVGFYFKEQLDSASYYYNESYKIKLNNNADNYQLAIATCNIGIVQEMLGEYDNAIALYNKSVQYDLLDRGEEIGILSDVYVALSNTYFKKNDLEKAEEFANKALRLAIKKYGIESPQTSFVYVSYANIFELKGDYEKNIEYLNKALNIRRKTYGNNHRWTAESLLSISEAQIEIGQFREAEKNYTEAISIAKSVKNNLIQAYAEMGLGNLYTKTNQYNLSAKLLKDSKEKFTNVFGDFHGTHFSVLVFEAENYFKKGDREKALQIIEFIKANAANSNLFYHLDALALELDIALDYFNTNDNLKLLKTSIDNIDEIKEMLFNIKKDYPTTKSKIHINNSMDDLISKAIEASYILYNNTNNLVYIERAFGLSELNRSSALTSGIQDVRFKKMANVPEELLNNENKLNHELASLKKEIYYEENEDEPDVKIINDLLSEQLICRSKLDSLLAKTEAEYPKYYQLKYSDKKTNIKDLQNSILKDDETVIEYFLSENYMYVFVISTSEVNFKRFSKSKEIQTKVNNYRNRLNKREDITELSKELYSLLLKDLSLKTKRLIIIPDKELNHLPFEALMNANKFLVEDYIVCYSGSASLLQTQKDNFFDFKFTSNWSGFAPSFNLNSTLVSNQTEIEAIAKLMKGNMFLGDDASVKNFKEQALDASILHLATHAEIDNNNPLYSKLVFSKDSVLTASDIYTLPINAELAVLSACETGFGKLEKSEGVMSMSRAFQYAGVSSTVMSLWKVPDQETAKLMELFYKYLKKGNSKDEALKNAKTEYLKTIDDVVLKHPFYWSGFVISGDVSAIESNSKLWLILLVFFGVLLLFLSRRQLIKLFK